MYIFGSNGYTNVGTMDTPMNNEYESGDFQAIINNIIKVLSPLNSQEVFPYPLKYMVE